MDRRESYRTLSQELQGMARRYDPKTGSLMVSMPKNEYAKFILVLERLENTARKSVVRKKAVTAQNNALALANRLRNEAIQGRLDAEKHVAELQARMSKREPIVQLPDGNLECMVCENQYMPSEEDRVAIATVMPQ